MELSALLVTLLLGVEIFRPMRDLRSVLHQGMVGLSAAQGLYRLLDAVPPVADAPARDVPALEPSIAFDGVRFAYPGSRRVTHERLSFAVRPGERVGVVGPSGVGKSSIVRLLLRFSYPDAGSARIGGQSPGTMPCAGNGKG